MKKYRCFLTRTLNWEIVVSANNEDEAEDFIGELLDNNQISDKNAQRGYVEISEITEVTEKEDAFYEDCNTWCCFYCKHRPSEETQNDGTFVCPRRPYSLGNLNSRDYYDCFEEQSDEDITRIYN